MAFTRDFTNAPEGALKVNGPIQVAIVDHDAYNVGDYVPATGELIYFIDYNADKGRYGVLKFGDGSRSSANLPAILTRDDFVFEGIECGDLMN